MSARIVLAISALMLMPWTAAAMAEPLISIDLSSPAVRCAFATNKHCNLDGTDTVGAIPIPGIVGSAVLHSLTFPANPGSTAAGTTGYEFRLDMSQAIAGERTACVTRLTLDAGPISKLAYTGRDDRFDVFVINTRVPGMIGLASAERTGKAIVFAFAKPVCPGTGSQKGESSFFFGFAAAAAPQEITARVSLDSGAIVDVAARTPAP